MLGVSATKVSCPLFFHRERHGASMPNPVLSTYPRNYNFRLSFTSILLVEVDQELRSSRRLLLSSLNHPILAVCNYEDVSKLPPENNCGLVVIGLAPSEQEALRITRHVRKTWPRAKILLFGRPSERFDDPLYDESIVPSGNPAGVVEAAHRLLGSA